MIRRPPRSTQSRSSAASDVYKRQVCERVQSVKGCKKLNELVEEHCAVIEKAKTGTLTIDTMEKEMIQCMEKYGITMPMTREMVEKAYATFTSEKAKAMKKEDIAKEIRKMIEAKKTKIEGMSK
eukprot:TRINITY_DN729_c0_g1_i11.p1 TRINITY_DN729_c0_g1~~TRINITY_DN729_c0_g1_i11.p1  ORF type:complete len:132 (-),score=56.15 TRINITY_DN729_c0_g1_i11:106-477(-)